MRTVRNVGIALLALAVAGSSAVAQRTRTSSSSTSTLWELGADGGIGMELSVPAGANKTTTIQIPLSSVRAGFFINEAWSLEPSLMYIYSKTEGSPGGSFYKLGFAGLYHTDPNRMRRQLYVRPFLNLLGFSGGGASNSDTELGVGVGLKWPRLNGRMAWRGEVNLAREMDAEVSALNVLWGISFFTR